jgi:hypothetical protein
MIGKRQNLHALHGESTCTKLISEPFPLFQEQNTKGRPGKLPGTLKSCGATSHYDHIK